MKRAKRASRPIPAKYLFAGTLLAACTSYFIYVFRINAVYIDNTVFHGFSAMLFGGNILTAAILFSLFLLQAYRVQKKQCTRVHAKAVSGACKNRISFYGRLFSVCCFYNDFFGL